jgi:hypothetical protein
MSRANKKRPHFWGQSQCRRRDLNPHAFRGRRILNPLRLPVPPLRLGSILDRQTPHRSAISEQKLRSAGSARSRPSVRLRPPIPSQNPTQNAKQRAKCRSPRINPSTPGHADPATSPTASPTTDPRYNPFRSIANAPATAAAHASGTMYHIRAGQHRSVSPAGSAHTIR